MSWQQKRLTTATHGGAYKQKRHRQVICEKQVCSNTLTSNSVLRNNSQSYTL